MKVEEDIMASGWLESLKIPRIDPGNQFKAPNPCNPLNQTVYPLKGAY
jgi:hypothetical protein